MRNLLKLGIILILISSCSNNDFSDNTTEETNTNTESILTLKDKEGYLVKFAEILSKSIYESQEVREFIKSESIKQFDRNYDVLYYLIKDEMINDVSFRDILISHSSVEDIENIELNIPLLNILVPEIAFFDIFPEDLNTTDNEIPVAVSTTTTNLLYLNGKEEARLSKKEIPGFHVFVVNENSRVVIPEINHKSLSIDGHKNISFRSPSYDGSLYNNIQEKSSTIADWSTVGSKTINAFKYFYKDDGSINQKAFQRDYIYYGITPQNKAGSLNQSVSEYISYIKINPNALSTISDQNFPNTTYNDPRIKAYSTSVERREYSLGEQIDKLWTKGAYNFRFEIISSKQEARIVYVPLRPDQLWDFHISHSRRHSTWFRHSKNTYTIDERKFTPKKVFLGNAVSLGKWNISEESLIRVVKIYEEDHSGEIKEVYNFDTKVAFEENFSGSSKVGVGLKDIKVEGSSSASANYKTSKAISKSITITRKEESDHLGTVPIYFYDPIIENVTSYSGHKCLLHTYNSGHVEFGITVM